MEEPPGPELTEYELLSMVLGNAIAERAADVLGRPLGVELHLAVTMAAYEVLLVLDREDDPLEALAQIHELEVAIR